MFIILNWIFILFGQMFILLRLVFKLMKVDNKEVILLRNLI